MRKWFRIAVVVAIIIGAVGYVLSKVKQSPEKAAEVFEGVRETAKASPEKAAALYDAARGKLQRDEETDVEIEATAS